jgi:hypothetical protein
MAAYFSDESEPLRLLVAPGGRSIDVPIESVLLTDVPGTVAADFVAQHDLPESYIERISNFIQAHLDVSAKDS